MVGVIDALASQPDAVYAECGRSPTGVSLSAPGSDSPVAPARLAELLLASGGTAWNGALSGEAAAYAVLGNGWVSWPNAARPSAIKDKQGKGWGMT